MLASPCGCAAVTVHPVMLATFASRPDQVSENLFCMPSRKPSKASRCNAPIQSAVASRRAANAARKSAWKNIDIRFNDSRAWKRSTRSPPSVATVSATPYTSRR